MNDEYIARIVAKVDTTAEGGCHLWKGALDNGGYGIVNVGHRQRRVHRLMWEYANGKAVPDGLMVRHQCGVRACCNPAHLLVGTAWDNAQDTVRHRRYRSGENHGTSKLTSQDVEMAFALRKEGRTIQEVAQAIGLSYSSTNNLLNGRSWKDMTRPDGMPARVTIQRISPDAIETARQMRDDEHRSWRQIENATGYSRQYLQEHLPRRTGYNPNPVILSPAEADEAVRLRREGVSWTKLSRHFENRISRMGLYYAWRDRLAWWREAEERVGSGDAPARAATSGRDQVRFSDAYVRGTSHHNAKLDADKIEMIRALRLGGWSWGQIAEHVGVDRSTATRAGTGKGWAHLGLAPDLPKMVKGRRGRT